MQEPVHTQLSSVMQSHKIGRSQTSDKTLQRCCISAGAEGPRAPSNTLSRNWASDSGFCYSGWPRGEKVRVPRRRIRSFRCFAPHTDRKSVLWALNGPPMGMAPVRDQIFPYACVWVSVSSEKKTRFLSCMWGRWVKRLEVLPRSVKLLIVTVYDPYHFMCFPPAVFCQPCGGLRQVPHNCGGVDVIGLAGAVALTDDFAAPVRQAMDPGLQTRYV